MKTVRHGGARRALVVGAALVALAPAGLASRQREAPPLESFEFVVATVDASGVVIDRRPARLRRYTAVLGGAGSQHWPSFTIDDVPRKCATASGCATPRPAAIRPARTRSSQLPR